MQFHFDASQEHQVHAVEAVASLLNGQACRAGQLTLAEEGFSAVVANHLDIGPDDLLRNMRAVQDRGGLATDDALSMVVGEDGEGFPNFSVEMETGTGKTYVYIRTMLELSRRYGIRKFIVVVPSVPIREGVLKTLQVTEKHFADEFERLPYRYFVYDSSNLGHVRNFVLSDVTEIMVMTIDAFRGSDVVFRQATDRLRGQRALDLVRAVRPVLVIDEPQNMETDLSLAAFSSLRPLFALRYSATHRSTHNLLYRLTPFDAYRRGLVKRIEVASVQQHDNANEAFVRVDGIESRGRRVTAKLTVHKVAARGQVREATITVRPGDSLERVTGRPEYAGYDVDLISLGERFVRFSNGVEVGQGTTTGAEREAVIEAQLRYTIEEHFRKQERLRPQGIKVLSLFFIDRVSSYAPDDGWLRLLFARLFDEVKQAYPAWRTREARSAQAAYFATRTRRGRTEAVDTAGTSEADEAAYQLIMRDKERLLSSDEEVCFIFSHSALREGWDSPNVYQICTLREVGSETQRRQQVGRGVRLAVNQQGVRVHDPRFNVLTVVASESYERFVAGLQADAEAAFGTTGAAPKPENARAKTRLRLRKERLLSEEFMALWERIKHKTRYSVQIDTERLVRDTSAALAQVVVPQPRVAVSGAVVEVSAGDTFEAVVQSGARTAIDLRGRFPLPNLVEVMEGVMEHTSPPMRVTRKTLLRIVTESGQWDAAVRNPHAFASAAVAILKNKLADQLVDGIRYERVDAWYEMSLFETEIDAWLDSMVPSRRLDGTDGACIYDGVPYDSESIERPFAEALERMANVRVYAKLPRWFTVPTPVGLYNPDWAIVMENPEAGGEPLLYLVRETKSTFEPGHLRTDERRKKECGERHFRMALGVDCKTVTSAAELP